MTTKATDEKTLALIATVKKQKSEIISIEKYERKTNCSFSYSESPTVNSTINLNVESSIPKLVSIVAFLLEKEAAWQGAIKVLDIEKLPFVWGGFSIGDWTEDIKNRINKIQIKQRVDKLAQLEERLAAIISPELKAQMELDEIEKLLG